MGSKWNDLPTEILAMLFHYMPAPTLSVVAQIGSKFNDAAKLYNKVVAKGRAEIGDLRTHDDIKMWRLILETSNKDNRFVVNVYRYLKTFEGIQLALRMGLPTIGSTELSSLLRPYIIAFYRHGKIHVLENCKTYLGVVIKSKKCWEVTITDCVHESLKFLLDGPGDLEEAPSIVKAIVNGNTGRCPCCGNIAIPCSNCFPAHAIRNAEFIEIMMRLCRSAYDLEQHIGVHLKFTIERFHDLSIQTYD